MVDQAERDAMRGPTSSATVTCTVGAWSPRHHLLRHAKHNLPGFHRGSPWEPEPLGVMPNWTVISRTVLNAQPRTSAKIIPCLENS
jgi:hypothetical protein